MPSDSGHDVAQQRVPGGMSLSIVDRFEPVDIDIGEHELHSVSPRAIDITRQHDQSELSSEGTGQLIDLRVPQISPGLLEITHGSGAVRSGLVAV
jgi:hypothetical protein